MAWSDHLGSLDVSNVFVYVGDAVRWDYLHDSIRERGVAVKTVASSTHSPTSFASLATGLYPPKTGVFAFDHRLKDGVLRLFDLPGYEGRFLNSVREQSTDVDPIHSVLGTSPPAAEGPLDGMQPLYAVMERGPGGHAPYGRFDGTAREYFLASDGRSAAEFRRQYAVAVEDDAELFASRLAQLERRGELSDTLVVYTSDHGELLGEGGLLGHNGPMRPELVTVPTVFIHPELPSDTVDSTVFRHVDLIPTIARILGFDLDQEFDGTARTDVQITDPGVSFYRSSFPTRRVPGLSGILEYDGVFNADGGYVFARSSRHDRAAILLGKTLRSPKRSYLRHHLAEAFQSYLAGDRRFGAPGLSHEEAATLVEQIRRSAVEAEQIQLSNDAEQHLEALGYL